MVLELLHKLKRGYLGFELSLQARLLADLRSSIRRYVALQMHHLCLVTVSVILLQLIDPVLGILQLPQKFLVRDLQLLDDRLLLSVLGHFLFNLLHEVVIDLAVLSDLHKLVILLILLKHVILNLHHYVKSHLFEFGLDLVVLFFKFVDVLILCYNLTLGLGQFLLQVLKFTLVLNFKLCSFFVECRLRQEFFIQFVLDNSSLF